MLNCLLKNLQLMGILIAMYIGAFGANTLLGIYNNLASVKENFSKTKFLQGLARGGITLGGSLLITIIISLLPDTLTTMGITVEDGMMDGISIVAIAGVMVTAITRYLKDALNKFYAILYNKNSEENETTTTATNAEENANEE